MPSRKLWTTTFDTSGWHGADGGFEGEIIRGRRYPEWGGKVSRPVMIHVDEENNGERSEALVHHRYVAL